MGVQLSNSSQVGLQARLLVLSQLVGLVQGLFELLSRRSQLVFVALFLSFVFRIVFCEKKEEIDLIFIYLFILQPFVYYLIYVY